MKVMFVTPGDGRGCSMIFARRQGETLRAIGVEVCEFYLSSRTSAIAMAREMRRFLHEKRAFRPDVVHAQFGTATAIFAALGAGTTPVVITYRGSDLNRPPKGGLRAAAARTLSQAAALRARRIVCVSAGLRDRLWWRQSRVTVMPSGVDTGVFRPRPRSPARQRLGWPAADLAVLFNAGTDPQVKRADLARAAVAAGRAELPHLRLQVLDGSTPPERVPELMNAADCLLVTSDQEGSPTVVQEALASNLPVVSVDVGDVRERLSGVSNTCVVERDAQALGRAIVELVREPLHSDGVLKVPEFCSTRIAKKLLDIYEQAARYRPIA